jgi:hypothetical protein
VERKRERGAIPIGRGDVPVGVNLEVVEANEVDEVVEVVEANEPKQQKIERQDALENN